MGSKNCSKVSLGSFSWTHKTNPDILWSRGCFQAKVAEMSSMKALKRSRE